MASWKDYYGGNYISAKQLGKRRVTGSIVAVTVETITGLNKEESTRVCLTIKGLDKMVALNKSNCEILDKAYGEDIDKWKGKIVTISTHTTLFNGEKTSGLLVTPKGRK